MIDRPRTSPGPSPDSHQGLAAGRLRAQRALARRIRRTVALIAVCLFMASWLLIFVVLVNGHDPALAHRQTSSSSTSTQVTESSQPQAKSSQSESASSSGSAESSKRSNTETATTPMTTRQS